METNFADGVDNRHDAYIKIPAVDGERGVTYHLHNTVGDCHHEIGQPQSGDIADGFAAGTHTGYTDAQDGLRAGKESHGSRLRKQNCEITVAIAAP